MGMASKFDYHVHESHSGDAREATIPVYIEAAETKGVEEICFTTHLITSGPDIGLSIRDSELEEYFESIHSYNDETDVDLKPGLEVDYFPGDQRHVEGILDEFDWDFILGSVHLVDGWDVGSKKRSAGFFAGRSLLEATGDYYRMYEEAIESGLFDMMSHPDYWRRYLHNVFDEPARWVDYGEACVDAIDALKSYGIGVEVNTSGYRHEHGVQYPIREFLEAVHRNGIKKMNIGSDSHLPEHLGYRLPDAVEMLRDIGFKYVTSFNGRKAIYNPI